MLLTSKPTLGECEMSEQIRGRHWGRQMDDVMSEMARQATICKVKLLDPGVIDAVIRNDESVCGTSNPLSFKKLRDVMLLGFVVRGSPSRLSGRRRRAWSRRSVSESRRISAISWVAPPEGGRKRLAVSLGGARPAIHMSSGQCPMPDASRAASLRHAMMLTPPSTYSVSPDRRRAYGVAR